MEAFNSNTRRTVRPISPIDSLVVQSSRSWLPSDPLIDPALIHYSRTPPSDDVTLSPIVDSQNKFHHQQQPQQLFMHQKSTSHLRTPPSKPPPTPLFSTTPVKIEEDVLVMDGILVNSPLPSSGSGNRAARSPLPSSGILANSPSSGGGSGNRVLKAPLDSGILFNLPASSSGSGSRVARSSFDSGIMSSSPSPSSGSGNCVARPALNSGFVFNSPARAPLNSGILFNSPRSTLDSGIPFNSPSSSSSGSGSGNRAARLLLDSVSAPGNSNQICPSWEQTGTCLGGSKCQFSHWKEGMLATRYLKKSKPEVHLCRMFAAGGICAYGTNCRFLHHAAASSTQMDWRSGTIDWSPADDGIAIHLPSSCTDEPPARESVDAYINNVLSGPRQKQRFPAFKHICPQ